MEGEQQSSQDGGYAGDEHEEEDGYEMEDEAAESGEEDAAEAGGRPVGYAEEGGGVEDVLDAVDGVSGVPRLGRGARQAY